MNRHTIENLDWESLRQNIENDIGVLSSTVHEIDFIMRANFDQLAINTNLAFVRAHLSNMINAVRKLQASVDYTAKELQDLEPISAVMRWLNSGNTEMHILYEIGLRIYHIGTIPCVSRVELRENLQEFYTGVLPDEMLRAPAVGCPWLTPSETAEKIHCPVGVIHRLVEAGGVPALIFTTQNYRILDQELDVFRKGKRSGNA